VTGLLFIIGLCVNNSINCKVGIKREIDKTQQLASNS